jgi:hypothetical protein
MLSHLPPAARLELHRRAPAWLCGIRGEPRLIRGTLATVRGGYRARLVRVCMYCGDHDSGYGFHNGRLLPQHHRTHGACEDCVRDYHPLRGAYAHLAT